MIQKPSAILRCLTKYQKPNSSEEEEDECEDTTSRPPRNYIKSSGVHLISRITQSCPVFYYIYHIYHILMHHLYPTPYPGFYRYDSIHFSLRFFNLGLDNHYVC